MQTKSKLYAAIAKAIVVIIIVNMVVPNRVFAEGRALFVHTLAPPAVTKPIKSGTEEHEQKGVTTPNKDAVKYSKTRYEVWPVPDFLTDGK